MTSKAHREVIDHLDSALMLIALETHEGHGDEHTGEATKYISDALAMVRASVQTTNTKGVA